MSWLGVLLAASFGGEADPAKLPPVRAITRGPAFHWFGYYDKWQFDPTDRYVLGMEVGFEGRSPKPDDVIKLGMVDLSDGDRWIKLGESRAWNWQQGCMLQWLPGSEHTVVWNDRQDGRFVCHLLDVKSRKRRTVPHPVYSVSPDGRTAVTPDFRRIQDTRPGYGYAGLADPHAADPAPADSGIWRVDLTSGKATLILSLADIVKVGPPDASMTGAKHWFNHLLFSPDGQRFIFLHRWQPKAGWFRTRMCTARPDGSDIHVVDRGGWTSHFIWRDPTHILAWATPVGKPSGFWLFTDGTDEVQQVGKGVMTVNGHCTYLPIGDGTEWILNDTYPQGDARRQSPYLFHVSTGRRFWLGHFPAPKVASGEWRVDTHPRYSRDGTTVCIDSAHAGGRQMYLIDIAQIVKPTSRPRP